MSVSQRSRFPRFQSAASPDGWLPLSARASLARRLQTIHDRERTPIAEAVAGREIRREGLTCMDTSGHEHGIEAHPCRAEHIGLQSIAHREHMPSRRMAASAAAALAGETPTL